MSLSPSTSPQPFTANSENQSAQPQPQQTMLADFHESYIDDGRIHPRPVKPMPAITETKATINKMHAEQTKMHELHTDRASGGMNEETTNPTMRLMPDKPSLLLEKVGEVTELVRKDAAKTQVFLGILLSAITFAVETKQHMVKAALLFGGWVALKILKNRALPLPAELLQQASLVLATVPTQNCHQWAALYQTCAILSLIVIQAQLGQLQALRSQAALLITESILFRHPSGIDWQQLVSQIFGFLLTIFVSTIPILNANVFSKESKRATDEINHCHKKVSNHKKMRPEPKHSRKLSHDGLDNHLHDFKPQDQADRSQQLNHSRLEAGSPIESQICIKLSHKHLQPYPLMDKSYQSITSLQLDFDEIVQQHFKPAAMLCKINELVSDQNAVNQIEVLQFDLKFIQVLPSNQLFDPRCHPRKRNSMTDIFNGMRKARSISDFKVRNETITALFQTKMFSPHLISNATNLTFQKFINQKDLVSLAKVIQTFHRNNKKQAKYFFKFDPDENQEFYENSAQARPQHQSRHPRKQISHRLLEAETKYFEFKIKRITFEVRSKPQDLLLMQVKQVTKLLKSQQRLSDEIYQEAIEANYSHEQMTPLNSILGNSGIILDDLRKVVSDSNLKQRSSDPILVKVIDSIRFLQAIQQSGKIMYFYNLNQILRMKINKNEYKLSYSPSSEPQHHLFQVLFPFIPQILSSQLTVYFSM